MVDQGCYSEPVLLRCYHPCSGGCSVANVTECLSSHREPLGIPLEAELVVERLFDGNHDRLERVFAIVVERGGNHVLGTLRTNGFKNHVPPRMNE